LLERERERERETHCLSLLARYDTVSICIDKANADDDSFDQTSYEDGNSTVMFLMKVVCSFFW
jgi:hypothetical protein